MEGLIPIVYKSLKKNKIRRKYECLSYGAAATQTYNIEDFYTNDDIIMPETGGAPASRGPHHRRYNSVHVDYLKGYSSEHDHAYKAKQLVRFRSHRMLSSCLTGA
ncbi:hypothetical protein ABFS82_14G286500 [Erythranthe guttata]|uniref:Uncharacterized protein n=1 Tax=Erythranthe guttata TaxID=4155 RepID=A0A022RCK1_ERYGU|nr:hypothetical protein MIMGU_mgv1a016855mg [Erythranthe guttata]